MVPLAAGSLITDPMPPASPLRVCQVVPSLNRDTGGTATVVARLASALSEAGLESHLATLAYPGLGPMEPTPGVNLHVVPARWLARNLRGWSRPLRAELQRLAAGGLDVVHNHGVWMFPNAYARRAAVRAGVPLVISPHGMLDAWSLRRNQWKKNLAGWAYEHANLAAARLFHVTSAEEAATLRALGLRQPVALIPNGVDLPEVSTMSDREVIVRRLPALADRKWLMFMSRLHPKKGVLELLRAWVELAPQFPDWQLLLAGPDLDGHGETVRREMAALGLTGRVTMTGMLAGAEKTAALGNADLFVLPTHSENFGLVVAEALAHGVPVITTKGAPWSDLSASGSGWWIELNDRVLVTTLAEAMRLPVEQRRAMGQRGRALVREKYSWPVVAGQMKAVYHWLAGRGPQPECVQTA